MYVGGPLVQSRPPSGSVPACVSWPNGKALESARYVSSTSSLSIGRPCLNDVAGNRALRAKFPLRQPEAGWLTADLGSPLAPWLHRDLRSDRSISGVAAVIAVDTCDLVMLSTTW
jgi:hypothetical protein